MADIKRILSQLMQQAPAQSGKPTASKAMAPRGVAPKLDPLTQFSNQLENGVIRSDLNKPALPYTASKSWVA